MATGAQLGYDSANYYVWPSLDGFAIHLSLRLVRELSAQIASSGEIRGILLGRSLAAPFAATIADEFIVVPPSQTFEDARRTVQKARGELRVAGFFRSQREGRLRLAGQDALLFDRLFYEDGSIALLIRVPRRGFGEATLFYWQGGRVQPREFGFGFPFDEAKLAGGHPGWRFPDPFESEEEAGALPEPLASPAPRGEGIRWSRLAPTMILAVIAIVATQMIWSSRGSSTAADVAPAAEAAQQTALGLSVTAQPHELQIHWNRSAPAVVSAVKGAMRITDDGVTEDIPFEARELREGSVEYPPKTNDVDIRFEVTGVDGSVTRESVRAVAIP
ncbi:MAG TPA: hypothetical protein VME17_13305 [Bryobacteraceae bacterium]|nr:hypothetical protein [Bryobacteraceae bacterium]